MENKYYKLVKLSKEINGEIWTLNPNLKLNDNAQYTDFVYKTNALLQSLTTNTITPEVLITQETNNYNIINKLISAITISPGGLTIDTTTDYNTTLKTTIRSPVPIHQIIMDAGSNSLMNINNVVGTARAYVSVGTRYNFEDEDAYICEQNINIKVEAGYKYKTTGRPTPKPEIGLYIIPKNIFYPVSKNINIALITE